MAKETTHQYNGILMDSREEVWMAMYLEELKNAGYITQWNKVVQTINIFQPVKFFYEKQTKLKTKTKIEEKYFTLLNGLEYTPDFFVRWNEKAEGIFVSRLDSTINPKSWFFADHLDGFIEVKPIFDQNGKTAKFSIIQKMLWHSKQLFVDLIIVEKLFEGTFMPKEAIHDFIYRKAPTGKNKGKKKIGDFKTDYEPKTLEGFLNEKV